MFNDCGIAVELLRKRNGLKRIAYVDIDAHHGDGVYYAFEDDPDLIFADIHEDGRYLYPGTGRSDETGKGAARGTKLNLPVPPGSDDAVFAAEWPKVLAHVERHEPEFIILQCGADSLDGDPITTCDSRPRRMGAPRRIWRSSLSGWGTDAFWRWVAVGITAPIWLRHGVRFARVCWPRAACFPETSKPSIAGRLRGAFAILAALAIARTLSPRTPLVAAAIDGLFEVRGRGTPPGAQPATIRALPSPYDSKVCSCSAARRWTSPISTRRFQKALQGELLRREEHIELIASRTTPARAS